MKLEFELPGLPKTTNSGGRAHWAVKVKEANKWKRMVWLAVKESAFLGMPLAIAKVTLVRASTQEPDFDGLVSGFKHVLDGLVEAGVLKNDKPSVIGNPTYRWEKCRPRKCHIRVLVESLAPLETSATGVPFKNVSETDPSIGQVNGMPPGAI